VQWSEGNQNGKNVHAPTGDHLTYREDRTRMKVMLKNLRQLLVTVIPAKKRRKQKKIRPKYKRGIPLFLFQNGVQGELIARNSYTGASHKEKNTLAGQPGVLWEYRSVKSRQLD